MISGRIFVALIICIFCVIPIHSSVEGHTKESLYSKCKEAMVMRRYPDLIAYGDSLYKLGVVAKDKNVVDLGRVLKIRGEICGHASSSHKEDMKKLTEEVLVESPVIKEDELTYYKLSTLTLYYLYEDLDFSKASDAAYKALECAESIRQPSLQADALGGLTAIYFLKGDSAGWDYAIRCEEIAKSIKNYSARYVAIINMANYLFNQGNTERALKYVLEAKDLVDKNNIESEKCYVDCFLGDIYAKLGNIKKATTYYERSLLPNSETSIYDLGYAKMRFASFLGDQKKYKEAFQMLKQVEDGINKETAPNYYIHLILQMAELLEAMDLDKTAIAYYKRYMDLKDQQITAEKEKAINVVELKYKITAAENVNMQQSLEIAQKRRNLWVMTGIAMIFIITACMLWILNRRKNKYYKEVVKSKLEALEKQKELQTELNALIERNEATSLAISEDTASNLYGHLSLLMSKDMVYTQQDLSLEKLASMLDTNRTYLSHVIKTKANASYASYVNEFRLNHAIGLLSDPNNQDSLKMIAFESGFSTVVNFYHLFKQKVGMSPAIFRKNAQSTQKGDF